MVAIELVSAWMVIHAENDRITSCGMLVVIVRQDNACGNVDRPAPKARKGFALYFEEPDMSGVGRIALLTRTPLWYRFKWRNRV